MKKTIILSTLLLITVFNTNTVQAQVGTITTFAVVDACNIAVDPAGRVYTANGNYVYRIDSGGTETVVAGGGSSYGDGGSATSAILGDATKVVFDGSGNMYIADNGYGVVRKVNTAGTISTVAGNYDLGIGYSGDGAAATSAKINCMTICLDLAGNLYIADQTDNVIRKVNTSGIITTVAGNGTSGYSGDGGPAISAELENYTEARIWGIATDAASNLYISTGHGFRVRKVDASGIITTYAGSGSGGGWAPDSTGVGGPATGVTLNYPQGLTTDASGQLFIAEWQNCVLGVVSASGIFKTVAGNYTISFSGDGGIATSAGMNAVSDVAIDHLGNIYIADCHNSRIRKVSGAYAYLSATYASDSFGIFVNELCSGAQLGISTHSYSAAYSLKCYYGDGNTDWTAISAGYAGGGYASLTHAYDLPGTYTVKAILMNGGVPFDSLTYTYNYKLCNTLTTQFYFDANGNCTFDSGESHISKSILTEIDSNSVAIDTISSTSGIYYTAYGAPGDIYTFRVISVPPGMVLTCPSSGIVTDTLQDSIYNTNLQSIGIQCDGSGYDLSLYADVPVTGVHDQWGNIYVSNSGCTGEGATVTLHYASHYRVSDGGGLDVSPTPSSYTDSTITWDVSSLTSSDATPVDLYYAIWTNPDSGVVVGYPAHSYYSVYPIAGDLDTSNNQQVRIDTAKGGCDPNEMEVTPAGYIPAGTKLRYLINFTNTGNDTTYDVHVMDTLSDNVDISSFRLVMSSATMNISKIKSGGHNILKFDFPNINLLDSMHYPHNCSRGLVFTVNAKEGLADGTTIFNHAGVFFDYNPVVITDTVENIIGLPTRIPAIKTNAEAARIYPNPAKDNMVIETSNETYSFCTIYNSVGEVVMQHNINAAQTNIDIKPLPAGVYYVTLKGDNGTKMLQFVKM